MKGFAALLALGLLVGCSSKDMLQPPLANLTPIIAPPVVVKPSTFCRQVSKVDASGKRVFALDWDVNDTPDTAFGVETLGARYKASCEPKVKTAAAATAAPPKTEVVKPKPKKAKKPKPVAAPVTP